MALDITERFSSAREASEFCWLLFADKSLTPNLRIAVGRLIAKLAIECDREDRDPTYVSRKIFTEEGLL
jgi:hypothetical protein